MMPGRMLKGFTHARLACGCRIAFREGVEGQSGDRRRRREIAGVHAVAPRPRSAALRLPRSAASVDPARPARRRRVRRRRLVAVLRDDGARSLVCLVSAFPVTTSEERPASGRRSVALAHRSRRRAAAPLGAVARCWSLLVALGAAALSVGARLLRQQRAPEVEVARATQIAAPPTAASARRARSSSRPATSSRGGAATSASRPAAGLQSLAFEEGTRVRARRGDRAHRARGSRRAARPRRARPSPKPKRSWRRRPRRTTTTPRQLERQRALVERRHHHRRRADDGRSDRSGVGGAGQGGGGGDRRRRARASASSRKRSRTPTCARRSTAS